MGNLLFYFSYSVNWLKQSIRKKGRGYSNIREENMKRDSISWIFSRRSIRKFYSNPVEDEKIDLILKAAMAAPSASNRKPWHFIVVRDREILNEIACRHPYARMCYEATLAIVVCADPAISEKYWVQDCSASTENILLAGTALGLGTVWLGVHPQPERKEKLNSLFSIPENIEILSVVALGYPAETKPPRTQFNSLRVHREHW